MLSIYRRHRSKCRYADDRTSKKCRCALWATGTLEGKPYRKTLKTRSFERATQILREIEDGKQTKLITIDHALKKFIEDCEARNLKLNTLTKYHRLSKQLLSFCANERRTAITEIDVGLCGSFRGSWKLAPRTASKQIEKLRTFFKFCIENGWLQTNPAKHIKAPEVRPNPTLPFSNSEVAKIFAQAKPREATFFRLLLHSGLRILDAATLTPEKIINGKLFLYTQKTGTPVMLPLPPDLLADLQKLPLVGGFYFAVQSVKPETIAEYYRVRLKIAAKKADVKNAHPHRFRDTCAVRLLEKGVPLETVSIILGHTDIRTTQRSYAPWVKSLQDNLERAIEQTWDTKLVRVK